MKKFLTLAALFLMSTAANAATIGTFGVNPTSAQGAFSNDPNGPLLGGLFQDQYTFTLSGGPVFITVASATNTFAVGGVTGPFGIQNFAASIYQTFDNIIGNGDDVLKFGPQLATLDSGGLSQSLHGDGLFLPGSTLADLLERDGLVEKLGTPIRIIRIIRIAERAECKPVNLVLPSA